jgi:hypothetical protein
VKEKRDATTLKAKGATVCESDEEQMVTAKVHVHGVVLLVGEGRGASGCGHSST